MILQREWKLERDIEAKSGPTDTSQTKHVSNVELALLEGVLDTHVIWSEVCRCMTNRRSGAQKKRSCKEATKLWTPRGKFGVQSKQWGKQG